MNKNLWAKAALAAVLQGAAFGIAFAPCTIPAAEARGHESLETRLHRAAELGNIEDIRTLIRDGVDLNFPDHRSRTALMIAAHKGNVEVVRLLLNNRAHPNIMGPQGRTALALACAGNHLEVAKLLLAGRADPNLVDRRGQTPLLIAVR